jgi:hypothetical protein
LNDAFAETGRFKLGSLDDATEAYVEILNSIHGAVSDWKEDCDPPCPVHSTCGLATVSQINCMKTTCGTSSEPSVEKSLVYYAYAAALRKYHEAYPRYSFDKLLKKSNEDQRACTNEACRAMTCVSKYALTQPNVLAIAMAWDSAQPAPQEITDILNLIQIEVNLRHMFSRTEDCTYRLKGLICYYGLHYAAYFYNSFIKKWIYLDDTMVKEVGSLWKDVKEKCKAGHFQPSMLFYEKFNPAREDMFYQPCETDFLEISQLNGNLTRSKVFINEIQRQPFYPPAQPVAAAEHPKFQPRDVFATIQNQMAFARSPEQLTNGHANGHSMNTNAERRGIKRRRRYSDEYTHISIDEYKDHALTGSSTLGESEGGILSFLDSPTSSVNGTNGTSNGTNGTHHEVDLSKSTPNNSYNGLVSVTGASGDLSHSAIPDFVNINNPFDFTPNLENFSRSVIDTTNHQSFSIWKPLKAVKRFFFQSPGSSIDRSNDRGDQNGHTNGSTSNGEYLMDTEKTDSNGYLSEESNYSKKTTDSPQNPNNFEFFRDRQNSPNKPLDKSFYGTHTFHSGLGRRKNQFLSPQAYAQVNED